MKFEIEFNLWNQMSELGNLVHEIAKLCCKWLFDRFFGNKSYETELWCDFKRGLHDHKIYLS